MTQDEARELRAAAAAVRTQDVLLGRVIDLIIDHLAGPQQVEAPPVLQSAEEPVQEGI
jgi:hypothetical protein